MILENISNNEENIDLSIWVKTLLILIISLLAISLITGSYLLAFLSISPILIVLSIWFPVLFVSIFILTSVLPTVYQMTPIYNETYSALGGGINIPDALLLFMAFSIVYNYIFRRTEFLQSNLNLKNVIAIFILYLMFEIFRNLFTYGLSAPGEFRYQYLILVLPVYITLNLNTPELRRKIFIILIISSLVFPLLNFPIIGILKGWKFGPENRFFPSGITLGLVYGLFSVILAKKYYLLNIKKWIISISFLLVSFFVIVDSHRSVWLVVVIITLLLIWQKEIIVKKSFKSFFFFIVFFLTLMLLLSFTRLHVFDYILNRANAFINPQADSNAHWRLIVWTDQLENFYHNPLFGQGFGGYWTSFLSITNNFTKLQPHNFYIQTLVKLGIVGLIIYLAIIIKLLKKYIISLQLFNDEKVLVLISLIILIAAHVYYIVYPLDYYSWLFIGLGAATAKSYFD